MWSTIGLATARRVRVCGALTVNKFLLPTSRVPRLPTTTPAACPVSLSLVPRRGFAASKSPAPKKKTNAGAKKAAATKKKTIPAKPKTVVAKKPAPRKALTPEQKKKVAKKNDREIALLSSEPAKLPVSARGIYTSEFMKAAKAESGNDPIGREGAKENFKNAMQSFKTLSTSELERLETTASQNILANNAALKSWIESHSPDEIHAANLARRRLKKPVIKDDRQPSGRLNAYILFIKSRYTAGTGSGRDGMTAVMRKMAQEWRALSDEERQPFLDAASADSERYVKQYQETFGRLPPSAKAASSS